MNANALGGWALAAAALAAGYASYGWPGVLLAVTLVVFWLLLQFSRALRAVRNAGDAPVGSVASAVMLNARLQRGMTLAKVLALTRSLGERVVPPGPGADESWRWRDDGGVAVVAHLAQGRLLRWELQRPPSAEAQP